MYVTHLNTRTLVIAAVKTLCKC